MTEQLSVPLRVTAQAPVPAQSLKRGEPCTMVILGAGGDLTRRKLIPALFHLRCDGLLPDDFDVIGVARARMSDESFRDLVHGVLAETNALGEMDESEWRRFAAHLWYLSGDLGDPSVYSVLRKRVVELEERRAADRGRLFYLALPPSVYATTVRHLAASGIAPRLRNRGDRPWARIIIEKPFGNSFESAQVLNRVVRDAFAEHQVYRIDHYLGKETVQNILVFRFANSIFEPVWNRNHIHRVQITAAESVGIEHRAGYYEEAGVVRDMFQNHLLQLLSLTAMEPPVTFRADAVRDEKAKVLGAIRPISASEIHSYAVRGQYGSGIIDGKPVPGYREEKGVARDSTTPTYAALRLMIDNWRWQGVPFFLCSGKRMPRRATDITIQFRQPPHLMFPLDTGEAIAPNVVTIRVQPNEGISLRFEIKVPGVGIRMTSATMDFTYAEAFGSSDHSAYETLLLDCMAGDATLFNRSDAVEAAWRVVDPVIEAWHQKTPEHFPNYAAGTWGPAVANEFIRGDAAEA